MWEASGQQDSGAIPSTLKEEEEEDFKALVEVLVALRRRLSHHIHNSRLVVSERCHRLRHTPPLVLLPTLL